MTRTARWLLMAMLSVFVFFAAWRIGTGIVANQLAASDPERVLRWRPDHAIALLSQARRELATGQPQASTDTARHVLAVEPLQGTAFALIAIAADSEKTHALLLHRVAVRRAPRDTRPRVWLINHYLQHDRYAEALQQIDMLLHIAPAYREQSYPVLAQLAEQPAFAAMLVRTLRAQPTWRAGFLEMLQTEDAPATSSRILGAIKHSGGMDQEEFNRWLQALIRQQRWDEAYGRWADNLALGDVPLRAVHNGDFGMLPLVSGFDWQVLTIPGVELDFTPDAGTGGQAAHVYFPGRPVAKVNLEHPLLLAAGRYRLTVRMRAQSLDGEYGLSWAVVCGDRSRVLMNSTPVLGSFDWREIQTDFDVPATDCSGQWLQLLNPAPGGAAQRLSGDVWFDDVSIQRLDRPLPSVATLHIEQGAGMRSEAADFVNAKTGTRMADGDRLMLLEDSQTTIAYDNGCAQNYKEAGVYRIDQSACKADVVPTTVVVGVDNVAVGHSDRVRLSPVPVIKVIADKPMRLPIGR